jgi:uncharacterized protein YjdB
MRGVEESISMAKEQKQHFVAIGYYSDGSSTTLNELHVNDWQTNDNEVAFFNAPGVLTGKAPGQVRIKVTKDGVTSNTLIVDVTNASISTITVTPALVALSKGQAEQLTATAIYDDNSSLDVSDSVAWIPVNASTATVTSTGVLSGIAPGSTKVTASKSGVTSNAVAVDVSNAVVTSISVTPALTVLAKGQTEQLTAIATYSDGSSSDVSRYVTWASTNKTAATVTSTGTLATNAVGRTTVTATKDGVTSNMVSIEVTNAVLSSIVVTSASVSLAKGQTEQLTAIAIYSDNSSSDISKSVVWKPADTTTVSVTPTGVLLGIGEGRTTVTATKGGITSNIVNVDVKSAVVTSITVTPAVIVVAKGQTEQLKATAIYSDGSSSDISNSVTWKSADTTKVTVTPSGVLSADEVGNSTITAVKGGLVSNTVNVDVGNAVLTSIVVTRSSISLAKGQTEQLKATAIYSDGSSYDVSRSVTWESDNKAAATVTSNGLLSGVAVGNSIITAIKDGITSNAVNVDVGSAVITSITVTPVSVSLALGQTEQLMAIATYSDSTSSDVSSSVTWSPADVSKAIVTPQGMLSGVVEGSTTITAIKDGIVSNILRVDVTAAVIKR